jgi:hypothetical protein
MSTMTPPAADAWPRIEWPQPRADTGNGEGRALDARSRVAMSSGHARRVEHGRSHVHADRYVAKVGGRARGGHGVVADQRADAHVAELVG